MRDMFEAAELGQSISRKAYRTQEEVLRVALLTVQYELREADFPVVLLLSGTDRLGCTEVASILHEWMDPRYLEANVYEHPREEEKERPRFWRYWRTLPAKGRIGLFLREWTFRAIVERVAGDIDEMALDDRLRHIVNFEKALIDDGALVVKLWLHMPEKELEKRIDRARKNPGRAWRVTGADRDMCKHYRDVQQVAAKVLRRTGRGTNVWNIIDSTDARYRDVTTAQILIQALTKRLAVPAPRRPRKGHRTQEAHPITVLDRIDLSQALDKESYERQLEEHWGRLSRLNEKAHRRGLSTVMAFEGWDAAGKGGLIRRLTRAMDAAHFRVIPIAAPTDEELSHHYLWRFWRHLPRAGHVAIFDRSWYGRVLVERVEGLTTEAAWTRAYGEITDFEEQLVQHGSLVLKFWVHISPETQLSRFKAREKVSFKKYKVTSEDYRNRERWNDYGIAADEMIPRTSAHHAPWHLIAGDDKRWARVQVLKTVCQAMAKALK